MPDYKELRAIGDFRSLVKYLRQRLDWPIDEDMADDLTFDYSPEELGLDDKVAAKIREIKQIRPMADGQPWGIFWIDFEPKRLPVVAMRRILNALVIKQRSRRAASQPAWALRDLMFISATGVANERGISFAHFSQVEEGPPQLRTFSWDVQETHFYFIERVNLDALHWPQDPGNVDGWRRRWDEAFPSPHRYSITTAASLASIMAQLAVGVRQSVTDVFALEKPSGPLHRLYDSFRHVLIHDLSADDFADMYAQTVTYGLFSARATRSGQFRTDDVPALIPNTNPFLRDLLSKCLATGAAGPGKDRLDLAELGVDELVETLASTDMESILRDFGRQSRGHKEDPVVHFYDSFLHEYDPEKKLRRGVFYTPDPVVSFIVRSVDHLLRSEFGYEDGLADTGTMEWKGKRVPRVQILDPAVGTGTFLKHVIDLIYETFVNKAIKAGKSKQEWQREWNEEYVPRHLLPRLYGFELMMAPYAVAHMKLGLALKETGYDFASDERLRVYLTNTLQPAEEIPRTDTSSVAQEAREANAAKVDQPVTVVMGNPPYSKSSVNAGAWIDTLMEDYKTNVRHEETQIQALSDDYAKFIRFAHARVQSTGRGILAYITNSGYLDGPLFRDMRGSILRTFDRVWVLNLHGDSRKREIPPPGMANDNVFDIQQGVAITLMAMTPGKRGAAQVRYAQLWGTREQKYASLAASELTSVSWSSLSPEAPLRLLVPMDMQVVVEWNLYRHLYDVFGTGHRQQDNHERYGAGFVTQQDDFAVAYVPSDLYDHVADLLAPHASESDLRSKYNLCTTNQWSFELARKGLRGVDLRRATRRFAYRPFDWRYTILNRHVCTILRQRIMRLMEEPNLALLTTRRVTRPPFDNVFVANGLVEYKIASHARNTIVFPLYFYPLQRSGERRLLPEEEREPNLSRTLIAEASRYLRLRFTEHGKGDLVHGFGPEDLFDYMYAVFHSPTYRTRYAEFLKIDFPRLPLTSNLELFRDLAARGAQLVALHLMESPALEHLVTRWVGKGDDVVARGYPKYEGGTVWVNPTQGFEGVPQDVWEFHVGGYQVCHKWLKDRRGRVLSAEDVAHYQLVVVALQETIRLMGEIDAAIEAHGGWPMR